MAASSPATSPELRRGPAPTSDAPSLDWIGLDTLWLQVTGTICNIACRHCFISCGPKNDRHPFMDRASIRRAVDDAVERGVRDFYLTGGEPFLHPEILAIVGELLRIGPVSVLTNAMPIDQKTAEALRALDDSSRYSLDLRVSLDGVSKDQNDAIRGRGVWDETVRGILALAAVGIDPVLTVTEVEPGTPATREAFRTWMRSIGLPRPRLKFLAPFRIGREERRSRGYEADEVLRADDLTDDAAEILQCGSSRMVTARGVWPCPILINDDSARLGDTLDDAEGPIRLRSRACHTCWVEGVTCRT